MKQTASRLITRWWSVVLALAIGGLWQGEVWLTSPVQNRAMFSALGLVCVVFAFAAWQPFLASMLAFAPLIVAIAVAPNDIFRVDAIGLFIFAVVCVTGAQASRRERLVGLGAVVAGTLALGIRVSDGALVRAGNGSRTGWTIGNIIGFTIIWALAWLISSRVCEGRALRAHAAEVEAASGERARAAVADERGRIARELHDVVAHSVSVMVVQAGGLRRLTSPDQTVEREALTTIEETGRRALAEMRRMVGVMRTDDTPAEREPQPGLSQLDRLVTVMGDAGLPVGLSIEGAPARLPAGLDLSAYRIVQEALTNSLKHAGPARAHVTVRYQPDILELTVSDDGLGDRSVDGSAGNGLIGMRERVLVYGGTLEAGAKPTGGFRLHARLPIDGVAAPIASEAAVAN